MRMQRPGIASSWRALALTSPPCDMQAGLLRRELEHTPRGDAHVRAAPDVDTRKHAPRGRATVGVDDLDLTASMFQQVEVVTQKRREGTGDHPRPLKRSLPAARPP